MLALYGAANVAPVFMQFEPESRLNPSVLGTRFGYDPVNPVGKFAEFLKLGSVVTLFPLEVNRLDPLSAEPEPAYPYTILFLTSSLVNPAVVLLTLIFAP